MRYKCNTRKLKGALSMVKRAMVVNANLDVLTAVKIVAAGDTVALVGTDLEVIIGAEIEASVYNEGECGASWKGLNDMLPADPGLNDEIVVWWEEEDVYMHDFSSEGDLHQRMVAQDMTDFPIIPQIPLTQELDIGDAVGLCFPFMSQEDDRMAINGVYIHADGTKLNIVATDGRMLKLIRYPREVEEADQFFFTMNRRASAAVKVKFRDQVQIGYNKTTETLHVHGPKGELIVKDNLPPFPDYNAIVKSSLHMMLDGVAVELEMDRYELLEKLERMCADQFKTKKGNTFALVFELKDGVIELRYNNLEKKIEKQDCLTAQSCNGDLLFGIAPGYLRTALKAIDHQRVTLYAYPGDGKGSLGHCTLRPMLLVPSEREEEYEDYTVLMPFRLEAKKEKDNGKKE